MCFCRVDGRSREVLPFITFRDTFVTSALTGP